MNKADKPVVIINGDDNTVEVNITETTSRIPVIITMIIAVIVIVIILAVSHCCPELLADFIRWIISVAIDS